MSQCQPQEENEEGLGGETQELCYLWAYFFGPGALWLPQGQLPWIGKLPKYYRCPLSPSPTSAPLHILKFPSQKEKKLSDSYRRNIFFPNPFFKITNPKAVFTLFYSYIFYFIFKNLFTWLHWVLAAAYGI